MKKFHDLSYTMYEGMLTAPVAWHPLVEFTQLGRRAVEGSQTHRVSFGTHAGTHIDSPSHMLDDGRPFVDEMPLDLLIGRVKILRVPKRKGEVVTAEELRATGVGVERGDRVFVCFGWGKHWDKREFFDGYPTFARDAAEYLVERGVALLGMDTPSPDPMGLPHDSPLRNLMHRTLFSGNVIIVESLANLDTLPGREAEVIILPLKAKDLDGFPVRVVAVCEG